MWGRESETQAQGNGKGIILTTCAAFGVEGRKKGEHRTLGKQVRVVS